MHPLVQILDPFCLEHRCMKDATHRALRLRVVIIVDEPRPLFFLTVVDNIEMPALTVGGVKDDDGVAAQQRIASCSRRGFSHKGSHLPQSVMAAEEGLGALVDGTVARSLQLFVEVAEVDGEVGEAQSAAEIVGEVVKADIVADSIEESLGMLLVQLRMSVDTKSRKGINPCGLHVINNRQIGPPCLSQ
jgi:hypothetical protein